MKLSVSLNHIVSLLALLCWNSRAFVVHPSGARRPLTRCFLEDSRVIKDMFEYQELRVQLDAMEKIASRNLDPLVRNELCRYAKGA